jgi:hypothetical protein
MATLCVQCALKAMVEKREPELFDEEPDVHMRRVHPNPLDTYRERQMLEDALRKEQQAFEIPKGGGS